MKTCLKILSKYKGFLLGLFFILVYVTTCITTLPISKAFEYSSDEGINLIMPLLYLKGYPLYQQIWNDQPPLFIPLLAFWMKLFGISILQARIMSLFFSAALLWGLYHTIKNEWGKNCGMIAAILLLSSTAYLYLSASVMIGIASLALSMLSICFISFYKKSQNRFYILLSGIFMALSLEIKLITFFLVPIIIWEIFRINKTTFQTPGKTSLRAAISLWITSFLTVFLLITYLFFHGNYSIFFQQLITPHMNGAVFKETLSHGPFIILYTLIFKDYDTALLAIIGIIASIKQRRSLLPAAWLGLAFIFILQHKPAWFHYYLLISIPLCWLAAIGLCQAFKPGRFFKKSFLGWLAFFLTILTLLRLPGKYNQAIESLQYQDITTEERTILSLLSKYKRQSRWLFTDRAIFAFYANIPIPPELAMISNKRLITGNLTSDYLLTMLKKYRPEQLLLTKLSYYSPYNQKLMSYIENSYSNIYQGKLINRTWMPLFINWPAKRNKFHCRFPTLPIIQKKPMFAPPKAGFKLYIRKDVLENPLDNNIPAATKQ